MKLYLRSLAAFGATLAVSAVALVMSGVQAIGEAQDLDDEPVPYVPTDDAVRSLFAEQLADDELIAEYLGVWHGWNA